MKELTKYYAEKERKLLSKILRTRKYQKDLYFTQGSIKNCMRRLKIITIIMRRRRLAFCGYLKRMNTDWPAK